MGINNFPDGLNRLTEEHTLQKMTWIFRMTLKNVKKMNEIFFVFEKMV